MNSECSQQDTGLEQSLKTHGRQPRTTSAANAFGFGANWKRGPEVSDIGKWWHRSSRRCDSPTYGLGLQDIGSPLEAKQQETMSGSLKHELKAPSSRLASPRSDEISPLIGTWSEAPRLPATLKMCQQTYTFAVTINSGASFKTISSRFQSYARQLSTGVLQVY